jgi:hypothetical protein
MSSYLHPYTCCTFPQEEEEQSEEEQEEFYCVACEKSFKSDRQLANHER